MSTHPYIPLYVDDYDAHTSHLSPAEDGIYGRLLRLCWRSPGCSLPIDHAWIARKVRLSSDDYEAIAKPVLEEFFRLQRGRFVQKRLKAEYDDISRKKTARQQAGKKGGTAKARKTKDNEPSIATVLLPDAGASPKPYPEPEEEIHTDRERARAELKRMGSEAKEAAGDALASMATTPGIAALTPLTSLLKASPPCQWDADVLPGITSAAAWHRSRDGPGSMRSWTTAVKIAVENRDRRLAGTPAPVIRHERPDHQKSRSERNMDAAFAGFEILADARRPGFGHPGSDPQPAHAGGGQDEPLRLEVGRDATRRA